MSGCLILCLLALTAPSVVLGAHHVFHEPEGYVYRGFSLLPPYISNGMDITNWDYSGSTMVTDNYVRLTPDRQV